MLVKETEVIARTERKKKFLAQINKISSAFLLVIASLPIAGLFLGVGGAVVNLIPSSEQIESNILFLIANFSKNFGNYIFANLPVLFCVSIAIAFSQRRARSGLIAIIVFLLFNAMISSFLFPVKGDSGEIIGYNFLFFRGDWMLSTAQITQNLGITTLNSGIVGGISIGFLTAYLYNRFADIELPKIVAFFSGVRFVPVISFFAVIPFTIIFSLIWPFLGLALSTFGKISAHAPSGIDSLVYQIIHRSLNPFGLHHAFYLPLWQTLAGGEAAHYLYQWAKSNGYSGANDARQLFDWFNDTVPSINGHPIVFKNFASFKEIYNSVGDQLISFAIIGYGGTVGNGGFFVQDMREMGLHLGRFGPSGWFPYMIFGLPAAAMAMILSVPRAKRKMAFGIYGSAALTSILTGITEPIEFTFLFVSPLLYYFVHVPLCGISGLFSNFNAVGFYVSATSWFGGVIELISYGVLPWVAGHKTNWFFVPVIGLPLAAIYFVVFFFVINSQDIKIPGREDVISTGKFRLFSKEDWRRKFFGLEEKVINK